MVLHCNRLAERVKQDGVSGDLPGSTPGWLIFNWSYGGIGRRYQIAGDQDMADNISCEK